MKIRLNPKQQVDLIPELADLIKHPPDKDVIIRTLSRKLANDQPLIQGDLVIAGKDTLSEHPRAVQYPVHFRKTYYPVSFHPPATLEYNKQEEIAPILDLPPPIGADTNCFRSCFLSGIPLAKLSPFGVDPEVTNLQIAEKTDPGKLIGLWKLLADLYKQIEQLHKAGFVHGDLFLHNVIVSTSPVKLYLIDFALAVRKEETDNWDKLCKNDLSEVYRHALWVQAGLGIQTEEPGPSALDTAEKLLPDSYSACLEKIDRHSLL